MPHPSRNTSRPPELDRAWKWYRADQPCRVHRRPPRLRAPATPETRANATPRPSSTYIYKLYRDSTCPLDAVLKTFVLRGSLHKRRSLQQKLSAETCRNSTQALGHGPMSRCPVSTPSAAGSLSDGKITCEPRNRFLFVFCTSLFLPYVVPSCSFLISSLYSSFLLVAIFFPYVLIHFSFCLPTKTRSCLIPPLRPKLQVDICEIDTNDIHIPMRSNAGVQHLEAACCTSSKHKHARTLAGLGIATTPE